MAKTIDYMEFYVAIKSYKTDDAGDQTFDSLRVSVGYTKGRGFYAGYHPGWGGNGMWGCLFDFSKNPLTAGDRIYVEEATKNSAKRIAEMHDRLKEASDIIGALFDNRDWEKLNYALKNVALNGYRDEFKEQAREYMNQNDNQNQKEDKDMTTTFKAADLIGKTIILGASGAKYVVKSVNGDKLECDFSNGKATIPMGVPVAQAEKFLASGTWKIEGSLTPDPSPKGEGSKPETNQPETRNQKPETKDMSIRTEADVAEVDDILPVVTPKAKAEGGSKTADVPQTSDIKPQTSEKPAPKVKIKSETKPQTSSVSPQTSKGKLTYSTYDVVKVDKKTGEDYTVQNAKIAGFDLTDAAYLAGASFNGGLLPETIDGKQVGTLRFSHKWREAAKAICDKLNAGGTVQDCVAIMEQAKADRKQKINERIQKREARKAKRREAKSQKTYTQAELAEWLRKLNAGDEEAAKFFNDLAKAA